MREYICSLGSLALGNHTDRAINFAQGFSPSTSWYVADHSQSPFETSPVYGQIRLIFLSQVTTEFLGLRAVRGSELACEGDVYAWS